MSDQPLPPVGQEWYNQNRERFGAESNSVSVDANENRCDHEFLRYDWNTIKCNKCECQWFDRGRLTVKEGKIVS